MKRDTEDIISRQERSFRQDYKRGSSSDTGAARLEAPGTFRQIFAQYSLDGRKVTATGSYLWDDRNLGGAPMDFDPGHKRVYVDNSDAHTLVIGATGSKKSRLAAMPMVEILGAAGESMIVCDPKAEIYERTASFLSHLGYQIHVLNFRRPEASDGWNYLSIPYRKFLDGELDKACEYINDMSITLIPVTAKDPFWDHASRDLFVGLTLLLFYLCREYGLPEERVNMQAMLELRMDLFQSSDTNVVKDSALWHAAEKYGIVKAKLIGIAGAAEGTMSSILVTFDQHMSCFSLQPQLIQMLSTTTIGFEQIGFQETAVFLILPDEKCTYHPLASIFIKQIYEQLIDRAQAIQEGRRYPLRVNFVLDEFSSLPTIRDFPQMVTASRSRNLRFFLVIQSKHQLQQRYEEETDTILSNCTNWIFLFSRELSFLRELSDLVGSKNGKPLISVPYLQRLDKEKGECLVFSGRLSPYLAHLPDIDAYDGGAYEILEITRRYPKLEEAPMTLSRIVEEAARAAENERRDYMPNIESSLIDDESMVDDDDEVDDDNEVDDNDDVEDDGEDTAWRSIWARFDDNDEDDEDKLDDWDGELSQDICPRPDGGDDDALARPTAATKSLYDLIRSSSLADLQKELEAKIDALCSFSEENKAKNG